MKMTIFFDDKLRIGLNGSIYEDQKLLNYYYYYLKANTI